MNLARFYASFKVKNQYSLDKAMSALPYLQKAPSLSMCTQQIPTYKVELQCVIRAKLALKWP